MIEKNIRPKCDICRKIRKTDRIILDTCGDCLDKIDADLNNKRKKSKYSVK